MMNPSLLIVDPDEGFLKSYQTLLESSFRVFTSKTFAEGQELITSEKPDCVLVEYRLSEGNGHQIAAWARQHLPSCCVLLMASHFDKQILLDSFSHRVFDVLEKPFSFDVAYAKLKAAVEEVHFRRQPAQNTSDISYRLDPDRRVLHHGQQIIFLTTTEVKVLELLLHSVNKVVPRRQMVQAIWGDEVKVADNTLDTHLTNLRKKAPFLKSHIRGLRGVGYVFEI